MRAPRLNCVLINFNFSSIIAVLNQLRFCVGFSTYCTAQFKHKLLIQAVMVERPSIYHICQLLFSFSLSFSLSHLLAHVHIMTQINICFAVVCFCFIFFYFMLILFLVCKGWQRPRPGAQVYAIFFAVLHINEHICLTVFVSVCGLSILSGRFVYIFVLLSEVISILRSVA